MIFAPVMNLSPSMILKSSLLAYWPLANTVDSVNGLSAAASNASFVQAGGVNNNGASLFDGSSRYIRYNTPSSFSNLQSFSVSSWIFLNSVAPQYQEIFEVYTQVAGYVQGFEFRLNYAKLNVVIGKGSGTTFDSLLSTTSLSTGVWTQVGFTIGSGKIIIYINGVNRGELSFSGPVLWNNGFGYTLRTIIGANNPFNTGFMYYFNGWIDELAYWGRELTPAEMARLYNGANKFYPF